MYPKIYNLTRHHSPVRGKKHTFGEPFKCLNCQAHIFTQPFISGVQNRNHCPYCLYSRHVDHDFAGDRMSACKAVMQPIGLTVKRSRNKYAEMATGELMIIHRCSACGKLSINRIAADDQVDILIATFYRSHNLDALTRQQLLSSQIYMLQSVDLEMVLCQLQGCTDN